MRGGYKGVGVVGVTAGMVLAGGVMAAPVIEEVMVTAQKRSQSINDVPISISAFSGSKLDDLGVVDTRDLGNFIPGFTYSDSGYATPIYTLRGVGFNDATYNASSTVGLYVDEVNLPYAVMSKGASLDLERVEVLKGPQGILYGRNTTGGLINYIANKPGEAFEAEISGGYGRFDTRELEGFVSAPLSDTVGVRVAMRGIYTGEGYQYSLTRPDDRLGKKDKLSYRLGMDWLPEDTFSLRVVYEGWRDKSEPQAAQPIGVIAQNASAGEAALSPRIRNHPLVPVDSDDNRVADWSPEYDWQLNQGFDQISFRSRWDFSDSVALVSILSYGEVYDDGTLLPQSGYSELNAEQELNAEITTIALESRLDGFIDDAQDWMLGINISQDTGFESHKLFVDTNSAIYPITGETALGNRIDTFGDFVADQYALFGNYNWQFTPAWQLSVGARYTQDIRDFEGCSKEPDDSEGAGLTPVFSVLAVSRGGEPISQGECVTVDDNGDNSPYRGTLDESNVSARVVLNWTPVDDTLVYASVSRGFKSGGFPVLSSSAKKQYEPVRQEELLAYEIGTKNSLWEKRIQLNGAIYYYDYSDKQLLTRLLDPVFGPLPVLKNAPSSEVYGAEIEFSVAPTEGLLLAVNGSYILTEILEFESTGFDGEPTDFAGNPFNFSPEKEVTVLADYSFPITDGLTMAVSVDYSYSSETNSTLDQDPLFKHDDYGLWNARLRLEEFSGKWDVSVYGRNVTNEFSTVSIIQAGDGAARYAGAPRQYGVSARYAFD
ncbi:TonB-dependent receptor [Spongiibacter sp. KMU-166]|uniref:TonB-dependent receptor n=1 Tax=Spongiibacter thalassae TaxID=2721624 RepID=A0ABX1GBY3_9GAMM|nr:TonB-dependent receptor [Spongiibacter thalassae]NKI16012.1 TonB-dependent receptor [Spongiibacter thalassae]